MTFNGKRIGNRILVKKMRDVSNHRACKLTITRSNYRGLGHFFFPLFFSLSRFTCIESGKLRNAFNRKMTKQFSLALLMNENKQGQVCVYILLICAGCEIIRWPRWVEHTISNRLLRAERMSPTYTAIVADIEQTISPVRANFPKVYMLRKRATYLQIFLIEWLRIREYVYWKWF